MKLGSVLMILILAWNTVDDLCVANCAFATDAAPTSDDAVYFGSLLQRAELVRLIVKPPMLAAALGPSLPSPACDPRHANRGFPTRFRDGPDLCYLLMSLQL